MHFRPPAFRGSFAIRFSAFDAIWAFLSPWLALWLRGAQVLTSDDWSAAAIYCAIAFVSSLIAFLAFRIREGMTHLFSVHDALEVAKAVILSEFVTFLVVFSMTRLDGIPRSTPLIHALILSAGLISARAVLRMVHAEHDTRVPPGQIEPEHLIVIGSSRLSALYIEFLRAYAPAHHRVIAVLDDRPEMAGRSIAGVRILGSSHDLRPIIDEFKEHGICTDRVIVGGDTDFLAEEAMAQVTDICNECNVRMDFIPQLVGLRALQSPSVKSQPALARSVPISFTLPHYLSIKRYIDFCLSLLLIVILLPLLVVVAAAVLLDVGSPVFFWQRRIGLNGRSFQMHKFRTLKPAYDWRGRPVSSSDRASWLGENIRKLRLDELPQLLNVLVGDMSLVGPRPLLPHDQPDNPSLRLMVRPGVTGWAQVHGGKLLSPEEKNAFDEWYVRNASLWLDIQIIAKTILFILRGERRHAQTADINSTAEEPPDDSQYKLTAGRF